LRTFHVDVLGEIPLEKCSRDVHGVNVKVASSSDVQQGPKCGQFGCRRECVEEVQALLLREAFCTVSRLEDWEFARQLLDAKNPFATDNVNSSRRRDVRERVVANECFTLRDHGCEPLGGVWSRDGFII
ncbi:hypothetical protein CLOP_g15122, partial [Closterium sp. NIES-67]